MIFGSKPRMGTLFERVGGVLIVAAACWWLLGQGVIVTLCRVDAITAGFWTALISGLAFIFGVLAYSLGRYTFSVR
jgi:hypothetical protein